MPDWNQQSIHTHMHVYSSDDQDIGRVAHIYEDSFQLQKGLIFHRERYIPYSAIAKVEDERIQLAMSKDEINGNTEWDRRPNYEDHLGDPTQLFYDRGHGIHDPFDETNPDRT